MIASNYVPFLFYKVDQRQCVCNDTKEAYWTTGVDPVYFSGVLVYRLTHDGGSNENMIEFDKQTDERDVRKFIWKLRKVPEFYSFQHDKDD